MSDTTPWQVRTLTDPREAISCAQQLVATDPVAYSVFSTVTGSLLAEPSRYVEPRWYAVEDEHGAAALVAMLTAPQPLHLPTDLPGAVPALADHLRACGAPVSGVNGPRDAALDFADAYLEPTGGRIIGREGIGVYDLPVPAQLRWAVDGDHVIADESQLPLLTGWVRDFLVEIGDREINAEATARRQIAVGNVSLWQVAGRPVAMCWASAPYGGVVRVSGVYTPRAERGHGYASAVVAAASRREQERGHTCMLYTQLANPTSNKIYRALGYRHLGDDLQLSFA